MTRNPTKAVRRGAPEIGKARRGEAQLNATIARINAALEVIKESGALFKNISQLAKEVARICGIDRSLLLKRGKTYRQCLERYPELLGDGSSPPTPYNIDIDPMHPVRIRNAQLEDENAKLRNIVDDLAKRTVRAPQPQGAVAKTNSVPEYQRDYELTCQLVDRILNHKRAIRIIDNTLTDLSDISGIPKPVADSQLIAPYVKWKNARA
ncbi:hypothetical protein ALO70_102452 [Pseudomonas amygdali pv. eriobotryae]|uniref:Uncharacterized protein n=1 Tax=Pseudomonas amygdali pv. eriobotryae TaxID=129137 RepID=A0A0P9RE92_PSEA0|nr:hypothetical protein [Pseudomonas amygdali]KPX36241.1 hypothetical protein ALO70_102452 [Pseudomonas amygdali pv. eriobotryae]KWS80345.1 hypothetical protein AL052_22775 [Pseudomonas amygdali pv. eriobotryae]RMM01001.1 hypothetical protein ALQ86_01995 [Pseudomonas amygdali pv. eriobotryae]RMO56229.1 hypothetical protein ALQ39_01076 [Pseudomonas amygdali pv. eriobotryae]GFZ62724.1 hypothetical protein PSE10A_52350 [Pseudomonas amygdali pv. eriobotryae]